MRQISHIIGLLVTPWVASAMVQAPKIDRRLNAMSMEWSAESGGHWTLKTKNDETCAHGRFESGHYRHNIPKISNGEDLVLTIDSDAEFQKRFDISAEPRLSLLAKPDRSAVIYQLAVRTFLASGVGERRAGKLAYLDSSKLRAIKELGVDYIWLTGVLEQADPRQVDPDVVKGDAGSYYAIYDNWDVSSHLGNLDDMTALIERAHAAGLRVLIDFVSNHTARVHKTDVACKQSLDFGRGDRKDVSFHAQNNYYYIDHSQEFTPPFQSGASGVDGIFDSDWSANGIQYERPAKVTGNDIKIVNPSLDDWFETVKLNYGYNIYDQSAHYRPIPKTWLQMVDVAKYWLRKGVDGFRVDFAHAVPIEFWRYFSKELRRVQPQTFLLAEAYEGDVMELPGFSYEAIFRAGFDSVYNSHMYWRQRRQALRESGMREANYLSTPGGRGAVLSNGFKFTHYMENHDELRTAAKTFAPEVATMRGRADLGFHYSVYSALLPGHFLLHGGQELLEDASVFGNFAGNNGRTSIFDFVYQQYIRQWVYEALPSWMQAFRRRYKKLLNLKLRPPFSKGHSYESPTFVDLVGINAYKEQAQWVGSYIRYYAGERYLIVHNSDPTQARRATVHFTQQNDQDSIGALSALGIENNASRYRFVEVLTRDGWSPEDPNVSGQGVPGTVLFRSGNVPSGLFLGDIPAATTYVFRVEKLR